MKKIERKQKGFTLIEIVLVVAIAGTVFLAIYAFFVNTIRHDTESRYEIIAANLAQEGVEIVRNIRDENIMQAVNDDPGSLTEINEDIDDLCHPYVDPSGDTSCVNGNSALRLDTDVTPNRYQNQGGEEDTAFERECEISNVLYPSDPSLPGEHVESFDVECTVTWESFIGAGISGRREITATATLTNWQE